MHRTIKFTNRIATDFEIDNKTRNDNVELCAIDCLHLLLLQCRCSDQLLCVRRHRSKFVVPVQRVVRAIRWADNRTTELFERARRTILHQTHRSIRGWCRRQAILFVERSRQLLQLCAKQRRFNGISIVHFYLQYRRMQWFNARFRKQTPSWHDASFNRSHFVCETFHIKSYSFHTRIVQNIDALSHRADDKRWQPIIII